MVWLTRTKQCVQLKPMLRSLIEQSSAYIEQYHGGSAEMVSFDGKVVKFTLAAHVWGALFLISHYTVG